MSTKEKENSNWMQQLWRPMMGWMYMLICLLDMAVFPVLWALWQGINHVPITQWNPLTLQGAGLFHIAMGAVLGISAFGRTQEKLAGTAANPTATEQISVNTTNMSGVPGGMGMNNGMGGGFGGQQGGFGSGSPQGGMGGGFGSSTGGFGSGATTPTTGFSSGAPAFGAPSTGFGAPASGFGSPASTPTSSGFGAPAPSMATTGGFGAPAAPTAAAGVTTGFGGKKAPAPQDDPIL